MSDYVLFSWREDKSYLLWSLPALILIGSGGVILLVKKSKGAAFLGGCFFVLLLAFYGISAAAPKYISIYKDRIDYSMDYKGSAIFAGDVKRIEAVINPKHGCSLFVFVNTSNQGVKIPMVSGKRYVDFKDAIEQFCLQNKVHLIWPDKIDALNGA